MKFAPIVLAQSFRFFCLTVGTYFSVTVINYPRSSDRVWHVRLPPITSDYYFPRHKFSNWSVFTFDFPPDPPILRSVGQWDTALKSCILPTKPRLPILDQSEYQKGYKLTLQELIKSSKVSPPVSKCHFPSSMHTRSWWWL